MARTHHFHQSIEHYSVQGKKNIFPVLYGCSNPGCPYKGMLYHHAFYSRNALALTGTYVIWILRYYCPVCKRTFSLLPSFCAPYYQYTMGCIFFILFQLYLRHQKLTAIARKINLSSGRSELAYQHISFYRRRFLRNLPLLAGFFGSRKIPIFPPALLPEAFVAEIKRYGLFSLVCEYCDFQSRHFLSG